MARPVWNGSISFGLVNIPVRIFSATREHDVRFHQLAPDGSRIRYKRVSEKTGREVDYDDIKKGYETSKGKWVIFDPDELDQLEPRSTKTIDIDDFVALDDIDPIYYDRTYHVAPRDDAAVHAYALLTSAMEDRGRVGIGKVVMRDKQYLAAIRPYGKGLAMSTMLFADEIVPQSEIDGIPERRPSIPAREKQMAVQIIDSLATSFDPTRYHDDYEEQLRALIRAKAKGRPIEPPEPEAPSKVVDLMDALRASLDRGGRASKRAGGASRRTSTSRAPASKRSTRSRKPASRKAVSQKSSARRKSTTRSSASRRSA